MRRSGLTRPATYPAIASLTGEDAEDVIGEGECHKAEHHEETDLGEARPHLDGERLAPHGLDQQEQHLTATPRTIAATSRQGTRRSFVRSEEHTSELQSPCNLVCRLLLEKKKKTIELNI